MASTTVSANFLPDPGVWEARVASFVHAAESRRAHFLRLARRVTPCREEAEDIVQEALLRAFRSLPRFRGDAQMTTWLQTIVQNAVREWLREHRGAVMIPIDSPGGDLEIAPLEIPDTRKTPEQWCEQEEMRSILLAEIDNLSAACRRAIELCVLEQGSQEMAARELQVSVAAIKTRVFHAKQKLRGAMAKRIAAPRN
jgi:RNA polymerase sigma-70 factor, ECF subfamily